MKWPYSRVVMWIGAGFCTIGVSFAIHAVQAGSDNPAWKSLDTALVRGGVVCYATLANPTGTCAAIPDTTCDGDLCTPEGGLYVCNNQAGGSRKAGSDYRETCATPETGKLLCVNNASPIYCVHHETCKMYCGHTIGIGWRCVANTPTYTDVHVNKKAAGDACPSP